MRQAGQALGAQSALSRQSGTLMQVICDSGGWALVSMPTLVLFR